MKPNSIAILMPVFNDWKSALGVLELLDPVLKQQGLLGHVILVDDASSEPANTETFKSAHFQAIQQIECIRMARNLGHQRAISIGLGHLGSLAKSPDMVVVMDSDGEDRPQDLPNLIQELATKPGHVIFAHRAKRSEGFIFSIFYWFYKLSFRLLTGSTISFGNFSCISGSTLSRVVSISEIWNNYAAGIQRAKIPYSMVPTQRGKRIAGQSRMRFSSLILHGLSAISVYSDLVGVRALLFSLAIGATSTVLILAILAIRLVTDLAIPGWASTLIVLFAILLFQSLIASLNFVFLTLNNRTGYSFIPKRDYSLFVAGVEKWI